MSENPPPGFDEIHGSLTAPLLPSLEGNEVLAAPAPDVPLRPTNPTLPTLDWSPTAPSDVVSAPPGGSDVPVVAPVVPPPPPIAPAVGAAPSEPSVIEVDVGLASQSDTVEPPVIPGVEPPSPQPETLAPMLPGPAAAPTPAAPQVPVAAASAASGEGEQQFRATALSQTGSGPPSAAGQVPRFSIGQRIVRTLLLAALVAGLGAGARFGYQAYEDRQNADAKSVDTSTSFLPPLGSPLPTGAVTIPSGDFVDVSIEFSRPDETVPDTARVRAGLVSRNYTVESSYTDPETGSPIGYAVDVRGERTLFRAANETEWRDVSDQADPQDTLRSFEPAATTILTFADIVPPEALPFVTVVSETDEQLDVVPLAPVEPADETEEGTDIIGTEESEQDVVEPTPLGGEVVRPPGPTSVRHYRLEFDVDSFASAAPFVHAEWQVGRPTSSSTIDVWIDSNGLVRQLQTTDATGTTTVTLRDLADELPNFQNVIITTLPPTTVEGG